MHHRIMYVLVCSLMAWYAQGVGCPSPGFEVGSIPQQQNLCRHLAHVHWCPQKILSKKFYLVLSGFDAAFLSNTTCAGTWRMCIGALKKFYQKNFIWYCRDLMQHSSATQPVPAPGTCASGCSGIKLFHMALLALLASNFLYGIAGIAGIAAIKLFIWHCWYCCHQTFHMALLALTLVLFDVAFLNKGTCQQCTELMQC